MPQATQLHAGDRPRGSPRAAPAPRRGGCRRPPRGRPRTGAERLGLLVDLLEHEVLEAALLGGLGRPVHLGDRPLAGRARHVGDRDPRGPKVGDVALLEEDHAVRVGQDRRHVGGEERLALADPDDQGHVHAGPHQAMRLGAVHDRDGVGALGPGQGGPHRGREVAGVGLLDEVGEGLRVRLGGEGVAARLEAVAELAEVLDDPVVDHRDVAGAVDVRVGVEVVGPAVGRPPGVRQADPGGRRPILDRGRPGWRACRPSSRRRRRPSRSGARCPPSRSRGTPGDAAPPSGSGPPSRDPV